MIQSICICDLIPSISSNTRLCLIIHKREARKPTNSGNLAAKSLDNSEVFVCGEINSPLNYPAMIDPEYENIFLYPSKQAEPLTKAYARDIKKPVKLFVSDGNWGQAKNIYNRFSNSCSIKSVFLPAGEPTEYMLRKETSKTEGLSTLEAIARSFGILESRDIEKKLMVIFRSMVERTLNSRQPLAIKNPCRG